MPVVHVRSRSNALYLLCIRREVCMEWPLPISKGSFCTHEVENASSWKHEVENASSRRQPWPFNIERFLFHINKAEKSPFNKTLNIKASFGLSNYQIELVQRYRRPPLSESAPESTELAPGSPGPGPAQPVAVEGKFKISFKPLPINMTTSVVVKC